MRIVINITKEEIEHLKGCDSHWCSCGYVVDIIKKVHKALGIKEDEW